MSKIMEFIDQLSFNAIIHILYEHKDPLENEVDQYNFFDIDIKSSNKLFFILSFGV